MGSSVNLSDIAIPFAPDDRELQRQSVADLLHRRNMNFPGAQPVSFARHHLQELQEADYFMCEKTDGIRCLLYLTSLYQPAGGQIEAQFLIDRKNDYYLVPHDAIHIPRTMSQIESYHTGTLLDGELVQQTLADGRKRLAYLIFDCLAIDGENIQNRPFDKRLARIDQLISHPLKEFERRYAEDVHAQPFEVQMKQMELPYGTEMMFRDKIPHLPHGNDGLIFTCKNTSYVAGTDEHILKWKPPEENTIDFRLLLGAFPTTHDEDGAEYFNWDAKPELELHVNHDRGGYKYFAHLHVSDAEWEILKRMSVAHNRPIDGRIIECFRDPSMSAGRSTSVWRPKVEKDGTLRFRDDKRDANHISVVESVLRSIEDAVTEQDLIAEAGKIRAAFKDRQRKEAEARRVAEEAERRRRLEAGRERMKKESLAEESGPRYED